MGWKASTIIINAVNECDFETLLSDLGYNKIQKIGDESFESVINPKEKTVYLGYYKNNLIICAADAPKLFFEKEISPIEQKLMDKFPNKEICAIVLQSVINFWAYSVITNDGKKRIRAGCSETGTFIDIGQPLAQEIELFNNSKINAKGIREFRFEHTPDEIFMEDQVGENFVFEICSRYFEDTLDSADDLLFNTLLSGYRYKNNSLYQSNKDVMCWEANKKLFDKDVYENKTISDDLKDKKDKKWWQFW
jgi:hypothetical protein